MDWQAARFGLSLREQLWHAASCATSKAGGKLCKNTQKHVKCGHLGNIFSKLHLVSFSLSLHFTNMRCDTVLCGNLPHLQVQSGCLFAWVESQAFYTFRLLAMLKAHAQNCMLKFHDPRTM